MDYEEIFSIFFLSSLCEVEGPSNHPLSINDPHFIYNQSIPFDDPSIPKNMFPKNERESL